MNQKIDFRKPRDFGETINDTFVFIKQNLKSLVVTYYTYCGFFVLASMFAMIMLQLKTVNLFNNAMSGTGNLGRYNLDAIFSWEYFFAIFLSLLSYTVLQVSILSYVKIYVDKGNEQPTKEELWGYIKYYFLRVFFSSFPIMILLAIGTVLCILPGIWLFPITALFFPIMISENGSFGYAFNRMFKLITGNWWTTFAILLVIWIIVYATTTMISLPTAILNMLQVFNKTGARMSVTFTIITTVIQCLCQIFMTLPVICAAMCYYNLVERKESTGLMDKIQHFGEKPQDTTNAAEEY